MNDRIRELAVAAAPANSSIPHSEWNIPKEFIEKFALLIVRECAESLWTEECYNSYLALEEFEKNSKKIKQHFGVEE